VTREHPDRNDAPNDRWLPRDWQDDGLIRSGVHGRSLIGRDDDEGHLITPGEIQIVGGQPEHVLARLGEGDQSLWIRGVGEGNGGRSTHLPPETGRDLRAGEGGSYGCPGSGGRFQTVFFVFFF